MFSNARKSFMHCLSSVFQLSSTRVNNNWSHYPLHPTPTSDLRWLHTIWKRSLGKVFFFFPHKNSSALHSHNEITCITLTLISKTTINVGQSTQSNCVKALKTTNTDKKRKGKFMTRVPHLSQIFSWSHLQITEWSDMKLHSYWAKKSEVKV